MRTEIAVSGFQMHNGGDVSKHRWCTNFWLNTGGHLWVCKKSFSLTSFCFSQLVEKNICLQPRHVKYANLKYIKKPMASS